MKKSRVIISVLLALSLILGSIFISSADQDIDPDHFFKLGLFWGSTSVNEVRLHSDYGFLVYDSNYNLIDEIDEEDLDIDIYSDLLSHKENILFMCAADDEDDRIVTLYTDEATKRSDASVLNNDFSKGVDLRDGVILYENSGLRVINFIDVEHYVWGVVNKEMSYSRPLEALKAQAVCARTYAARCKFVDGGHDNYGFDICPTTDCQVYGGIKGEHKITTQACRETEGMIFTYKGEPAYSYFSSSNGGYTLSLYDAWGLDDVPYLVTSYDEFNPNTTPASPWKFYNTFEEIRAKLINAGYRDVGKVESVAVTNTNSCGAVTQITVTGTVNTVVVPRSRIMSVFNLKSSFFVLGNSDYKTFKLDDSGLPSSSSDYYVLSADGVHKVPADELYIYDGSQTKKMVNHGDNINLGDSDVCKEGYVYWAGQGFGHSIGMSQYGAFAMADAGYEYDDIIEHYYPGVRLESLY